MVSCPSLIESLQWPLLALLISASHTPESVGKVLCP